LEHINDGISSFILNFYNRFITGMAGFLSRIKMKPYSKRIKVIEIMMFIVIVLFFGILLLIMWNN